MLVPFICIWLVAAVVCGGLGLGWISLVLGLAPLGLLALWFTVFGWSRGAESGRTVLQYVGLWAAGALAAVAAGLPRQAIALGLAPVALTWLGPIWRASRKDAATGRAAAALDQATHLAVPAIDPEASAEADAVRRDLAGMLAAGDLDAAVTLATAAPDARLLPLPDPDMDNGLERLGDHVAGTDPALARRLYGLAVRAATIEFAFATAGAAGLATQTWRRRVQEKLAALIG